MNDRRAFAYLAFIVTLIVPIIVHAEGDPARGLVLAAQCQNCHGDAGENRIEGFPNLANQKYNYLVKQLREMRTSAKLRAGFTSYVESDDRALARSRRSNEIMDPFVIDLTDQEIEDLSAYYANQPCSAVMTDTPLPAPKFDVRCQVCHGKLGISRNKNMPNIAGQDALYLEQQLLAFKSGKIEEGDGLETRRAPIMESQVRHLSEQDIKDISLYYSRLPCR